MRGCDYLLILHYLCFVKNVTFKTNAFNTTSNQYTQSVLLLILSHWWWVPMLLILVCALLSVTVNPSFVFVALILIFIIVPTVLMFIYFHQSTTQEARIALLKKVLIIGNDGINIDFNSINKVRYEVNEEVKETITPKPLFIARSEIKKVEYTGYNIRLYLKGGKYKFITIPINEIEGDTDAFLAYILQYVER